MGEQERRRHDFLLPAQVPGGLEGDKKGVLATRRRKNQGAGEAPAASETPWYSPPHPTPAPAEAQTGEQDWPALSAATWWRPEGVHLQRRGRASGQTWQGPGPAAGRQEPRQACPSQGGELHTRGAECPRLPAHLHKGQDTVTRPPGPAVSSHPPGSILSRTAAQAGGALTGVQGEASCAGHAAGLAGGLRPPLRQLAR